MHSTLDFPGVMCGNDCIHGGQKVEILRVDAFEIVPRDPIAEVITSLKAGWLSVCF